ncbi:hypothetical protein SSX86_016061 [Deinandra increscens subsp. villosa]|uniref:Uncharacterized protein n=1 Tax=Deinandra increscens subsp. villosa TaxID=3103831 RepID=A0AAP0GXR2_9ASTR
MYVNDDGARIWTLSELDPNFGTGFICPLLFIDDHFKLADDFYSQAILIDPKNPELFSDHAQANIKLENFIVGDEVEEKSAHENADVLAHSTIKPALLDKNDAKDAPEAYKKLSSKEVSATFLVYDWIWSITYNSCALAN